MGTAALNLGTLFRQTPNLLLQEFFQRAGLLAEVPFEHLAKRQIEPIIEAVNALPVSVLAPVESDLHDVFTLADKAGTLIMIDLATYYDVDLVDRLADMENHYHRAMWLYLNPVHGDVDLYNRSLSLARAKDLTFAKSKRLRGLPVVTPATDPQSRAAFAEALKELYRLQGRGHHCQVDHQIRPNPLRYFFFCYPEDYTTSDLAYQGDELGRASRKPVFELGFIYEPEAGTLETAAPGGAKEVRRIQEAFCRHILRVDLPEQIGGEESLNLNPLRSPRFAFVTDESDGVEGVDLLAMRCSFRKCGLAGRLTFEREADSTVHQVMAFSLDAKHLREEDLHVTMVKVRIRWIGGPDGRATTDTFTLTWPDACSLKPGPRHSAIFRLLRRWGISA